MLLPRDAMLGRYMLWSCVCLSVCPSVHHKSEFYQYSQTQDHANNIARWPRGSSFLMPEMSAKFQWLSNVHRMWLLLSDHWYACSHCSRNCILFLVSVLFIACYCRFSV